MKVDITWIHVDTYNMEPDSRKQFFQTWDRFMLIDIAINRLDYYEPTVMSSEDYRTRDLRGIVEVFFPIQSGLFSELPPGRNLQFIDDPTLSFENYDFQYPCLTTK